MLEIRFLGEVSVIQDGERLELPRSRKTLALLAYLVVTGRRQRRERLCSLLWELPDDPRGALRWSLSKLRNLVDDATNKRILADRNGVAFEAQGAKVDVLDLKRVAENGYHPYSEDHLAEMARICDGTFLESLDLPDCPEFQAWRTGERVSLARTQARVLQELLAHPEYVRKEGRRLQEALESLNREFPEIDMESTILGDLLTGLNIKNESGAIPLPDKPSLAVLPFDNLSGDPSYEFFVDGLTEDIIGALSANKLFFVISRMSTRAYKGRSVEPRKVSTELGVQYLVEGSVRKSQNKVRVNAQLIDATTGHQVWSNYYVREYQDIFSVQKEITEHITAAVGPEFLTAELDRAHRQVTLNPDAREYFLRGTWHLRRFSRDDQAEVYRLAVEGLEAHPDSAELHGLRSISCNVAFLYGWLRPREESLRIMLEAGEAAVSLDNTNAYSYRAQGLANLYARRHEEAIGNFQRAIELDPNDSDAYAHLGGTYGYSGDFQTCFENVTEAARRSPGDPFITAWFNYIAQAATITEQYKLGLDWGIKMRRLTPHFPGAYRVSAVCLAHLGRMDEARENANRFLDFAPGTTLRDIRLTVPIKGQTATDRYAEGLRLAGLPD